MNYIAILYPTIKGGYVVDFPDFPEAFTQGDTLDEAVLMAEDVLAIAVEEYAKARKELPAPSSLEKAKAIAARTLHEKKGLDRTGEPFLQLVTAPAVDMTPVRISVSFTRSVLDTIDAKARQRGMTRSGFLASLAVQP